MVDLNPIVRVALLGLLIAAVPLAWLAWRHRGATPAARLRALTVLTLFLTFDLVLFGAFTRLTDSGLGCPDWPGCYGSASPLGAHADIGAAQAALPSGAVTHGKAWIEMTHRYLAAGVGALIVVLMLASWWQARRGARSGSRPDAAARLSPWWPTATFVWVCLQGAFGAWTVTMKLYPAIVTAHLLGGMALLALLAAQAQVAVPAPIGASPALRRWATAALLVVSLQVALGGWVSTNYAVLACSDFPTCQGSWWPAMDFDHGYTVLRELGKGKGDAWLPFAALTAIHFTHRLFAVLVAIVMLALAATLKRHGGATARQFAWLCLGLLGWQVASGLSNVVLGWPLVGAVAHTGGAAAMIVVLTLLCVRLHQGRRAGLAASLARAPSARSLESTRLHHV